MSRLDLLKKGTANNTKKESNSNSPREGMLGGHKTQKSQQRVNDLADDILSDDDFENELEDAVPIAEYDPANDDSDDEDSSDDVNVIEIDLDSSSGGLEIDPALIGGDEDEDKADEANASSENEDDEDEADDTDDDIEDEKFSDIVEGHISVDYSEEDIKLENEYIFEQRDQLYSHYVKAIKHGGMEIGSPKPLKLHDIVRISVTLTELKEQVGCEARVVSVFPPNLRALSKDNSSKYRFIVQFIGPNAPETDRVLSKYLLGYKVK